MSVGPVDMELDSKRDMFRVQGQHQSGEGHFETSRWPRLASCHVSPAQTAEDLFFFVHQSQFEPLTLSPI